MGWTQASRKHFPAFWSFFIAAHLLRLSTRLNLVNSLRLRVTMTTRPDDFLSSEDGGGCREETRQRGSVFCRLVLTDEVCKSSTKCSLVKEYDATSPRLRSQPEHPALPSCVFGPRWACKQRTRPPRLERNRPENSACNQSRDIIKEPPMEKLSVALHHAGL